MSESSPKPSGQNIFPTTHWTVVRELCQAPPEERNRLLTQFLDRYQSAFRCHLAYGRGVKNEHDVEDMLQGFITDKFIAKSILGYVEKDGRRLRDYLRRSLDNYVYSQHRTKASSAWDRREAYEDTHNDVEASGPEPCPFDIAWAQSVITEAVLRTKDQFFYGQRPHVWDVLDLRYLRPIFLGCEPVSYADLSAQIGFNEKAIQNYRVTALRALDKHLREVIAEYVGEEQTKIQEELHTLNTILRDAGVLGQMDVDFLDS